MYKLSRVFVAATLRSSIAWLVFQTSLPRKNSALFLAFTFLLTDTLLAAPAGTNCASQTGTPPCVISSDAGVSSKLDFPNLLVASAIDPVGKRVFQRNVDYQHPTSPLSLVRYYNSQNGNTDFGFGKGWNMTYAIQLRRISNRQINLMQSDGRIIKFDKGTGIHSYRFNASNHRDGFLQKAGPYWQWHKNKTDLVLFKGPIPVQFVFSENATLDLFYKQNRLHSVTDHIGNRLKFHYDSLHSNSRGESQISAVTLPDGKLLDYRYKTGKLISIQSEQSNPHQYIYDLSSKSALLTGTSTSGKSPIDRIYYNTDEQPIKWENKENGLTADIIYSRILGDTNQTKIENITINTSLGETAIYQVRADPQDAQFALISSRIQTCATCPVVSRQYSNDTSLELSQDQVMPTLPDSSESKNAINTPVEIERSILNTLSTISVGINSFTFKTSRFDQSKISANRDKRIVRNLLLRAMTHANNSILQQRDSIQCETNGPIGDQIDSSIDAPPNDLQNAPLCDATDNDISEQLTSTIAGGGIREIWADGCLSYFEAYLGTGRGFKIEEALAYHPDFINAFATATLFPVVDFLDQGTAVAVVSTDLTSPSYSDQAAELALFHKLIHDAQDMFDNFLQPLAANGQVSATQGGLTTTINAADVDTFVFELIIQHGTATPAQIAQILQAAQYMLEHFGIELQIIEIP